MFPDFPVSQWLPQACPAIQYRLRTEVLSQASGDPELRALQEQVQEDGLVREVLGWQGADGWLAHAFHAAHGMETGLRILLEKGLQPEQPALARALDALEAHEDRLVRGVGPNVTRVLDERNLGGPQMMRAVLLARGGRAALPTVQSQVQRALEAFQDVLSVHSLSDLIEPYQDKQVFRPGRVWPSIYHLRLLAWTQNWRNPQSLEQVARSLRRLVDLSPIPEMHALRNSRLYAPASFGMHEFAPDMDRLTDGGWMIWFQRMELLARLGVVSQVPALAGQVKRLAGMLEAGEGRFIHRLRHSYFGQWGAYAGLMLERDWRSPQRRENDLTFRSLLILHYVQSLA